MSEVKTICHQVCAICGDRAIGKNFNAFTCQPCKAFFRRNATARQDLKCYRKQNCEIGIKTRKYCKRCRLDKCYAMGMKIDVILINDMKKELRRHQLIAQNSVTSESSSGDKTPDSGSGSDSNAGSLDTPYPDINPLDIYDYDIKFINDVCDVDDQHLTMIMDNFLDTKPVLIKQELVPYSPANSSVDSPVSSQDSQNENGQLERHYSNTLTMVTRPIMDYANQLNELEGSRLSELLKATQVFVEDPVDKAWDELYYPDIYAIVMHRLDIQLRRMIRMCKMLTEFQNLCDNDRISLIKYGFVELYILRATINYDHGHSCWRAIMGNRNSVIVRLESMKYFPRNLYSLYRLFFYHLYSDWDLDPVVLNLLTGIILFNPNRPNLMHKDSIKLQQQVYMHLLQRYLQLRYRSMSESQQKCYRLLKSLTHLQSVSLSKHQNCMELDEKIIPYRILQEIFDIKTIQGNSDDHHDNTSALTSNILIY